VAAASRTADAPELRAGNDTLVSGVILTILYIWRRDVLIVIFAQVATDLWGLMRPV
jgi:hypothetical protein